MRSTTFIINIFQRYSFWLQRALEWIQATTVSYKQLNSPVYWVILGRIRNLSLRSELRQLSKTRLHVSQQTSAMAYRVLHTVLEPKGSGCWGSRPPRNFLLQMVIFPPLITGSGIFTTKLKTNWVFFINLYLVRTL